VGSGAAVDGRVIRHRTSMPATRDYKRDRRGDGWRLAAIQFSTLGPG
jgi:hypothetical protein